MQQVIYWTMNIISNHYKLIAIDLSKQIKLEILDLKQQINFVGSLYEDNRVTVLFIIKKSDKTTFTFPQNAVTVSWFGLTI